MLCSLSVYCNHNVGILVCGVQQLIHWMIGHSVDILHNPDFQMAAVVVNPIIFHRLQDAVWRLLHYEWPEWIPHAFDANYSFLLVDWFFSFRILRFSWHKLRLRYPAIYTIVNKIRILFDCRYILILKAIQNEWKLKKKIVFLTSTRCLVASKTLRFLVVVFLQMDSCFWTRSSLKWRPQMRQDAIPGGGGPEFTAYTPNSNHTNKWFFFS